MILNKCAYQHLQKTLIQLHVSTKASLSVGCSMSVPLRAIALQPFYPNMDQNKERNQKLSKCKRINVNGKHTLHMAVSINYCTRFIHHEVPVDLFLWSQNLCMQYYYKKSVKNGPASFFLATIFFSGDRNQVPPSILLK